MIIKNYNKEVFEACCKLFATMEDICGIFWCTHKELIAWCKQEYNMSFKDVYKHFESDGKISLRRKQMQLAESSASMGIFLGKNYLNQTEVLNIRNMGKEDDPVTSALKESLGIVEQNEDEDDIIDIEE